MVRVVLVDDVPEVLEILGMLYASIPNVQVVGTARNNDEALEVLKSTQTDVVSIDVDMGKYNGLDLCETIHATMPHIYIAMCSGEGSPENKNIAQSRGAHHFLDKPVHLGSIERFIASYQSWRSNDSNNSTTNHVTRMSSKGTVIA